MTKYKHIFFDLDHTLWDFDTNAKEALTELYAFFELDKKNISPFEDFYRHYLNHNQVLWDRYHKGFITADELKWKRMWRTLLEFKIGDEQLAKKMSEKFLELLPVKKNLFPYAHEILDYLVDKKYDIHLITNGFEKTQWLKLNNSGLGKYFKYVITSETSNSIKPQKEIFSYALQKAGAALEESIMIGDNLDADIQGAMNIGMDSIFVNHINVVTDLKPTYIVRHLKELEDIF
ncbi:YjjG family noncanonical pyrimidine nucleotidase [Ferruginibacter albus]|uniref:YjjG family noncanonical pyrimidine nucleotidase n=1 Tax=Ferruginibacter albus TaxID=2875540 RepID=UPI001CC5E726|nr:YjjG family noncanonical pyrimidine nucleotidase [Ferruginibacter albus]UAY51910.1 YjjG family noncanonical pyrimidine nucleotidase [Ferruginibacter albus]